MKQETKDTILLIVALLSVFTAGIIFCHIVHLISTEGSLNTYTDGVITATFDQEAGTLTFSGNGAVDDTRWWLENLKTEQRVFVRTIVFEDGITSIGDCEFSELGKYVNLEKVIFEGDINEIGSCAFSDNPNLTTVEFMGSCRRIDYLAFHGCVSLGTINIPDGCDVGFDAFGLTELTKP